MRLATILAPTAILMLLACGTSTPPAHDPSGASSATSASASASASTTDAPVVEKQSAPKAIALSPLGQRAFTVKVGDRLSYSYKSHASVGYGASQYVDGKGVVKLVDGGVKLDRPPAPGEAVMAGGDAGTGTYVFEAIGKGKATITIEEQFRGKTEHESTFTITVE